MALPQQNAQGSACGNAKALELELLDDRSVQRIGLFEPQRLEHAGARQRRPCFISLDTVGRDEDIDTTTSG